MSQQFPVRDTPEELKHFWQSPGSSVQSKTHCPKLQPLSSAAAERLQRWPWPCYSSLSCSHQELLKGMEGPLVVHSSSSHSPKGDGVWSKRSPYKKKKVYIFINAKINISDRIPNPSNMCAITLQTARRTASRGSGNKAVTTPQGSQLNFLLIS